MTRQPPNPTEYPRLIAITTHGEYEMHSPWFEPVDPKKKYTPANTRTVHGTAGEHFESIARGRAGLHRHCQRVELRRGRTVLRETEGPVQLDLLGGAP